MSTAPANKRTDGPGQMSMQRVIPALKGRDYGASRVFYARLGFKEKWKHQFRDGLPVFAAVERNGMQLFLTEHAGDCQPGGLVHFCVSDVDALYEEFQKRDVSIEQPPSNSLGPDLRDMLVIDPDGNRLSFLTPKKDAIR